MTPLSYRPVRPIGLVLLLACCVSFGCDPGKKYDEKFLAEEPNNFSQYREEVIIRHFFKDRRGGFFLDVGAATWKEYSTTYYLESELGWKGIAIDARKELEPDYVKYRPNTKFFSFFVSDKSDTKETLYHGLNVSSGNKESVKSFVKDKTWEPVAVEVPTITLNDLLAREKVEKIDFISLDIETYEPKALAGFDIDRYKPELVCVEAGPTTRQQLLEYFAAHRYRRIVEYDKQDWVNWYFTPMKEGESAAPPKS